MKTYPFHGALLALAAGLALAACGGGNDYNPPPAPVDNSVPPASASSSWQGFTAYIASLMSLSSETAEPVNLSAFSAPTDDADSAPPVATSADQ